jgi:hypothetical protein
VSKPKYSNPVFRRSTGSAQRRGDRRVALFLVILRDLRALRGEKAFVRMIYE